MMTRDIETIRLTAIDNSAKKLYVIILFVIMLRMSLLYFLIIREYFNFVHSVHLGTQRIIMPTIIVKYKIH